MLQKWHGAGNDFLVDVTSADSASWWTAERAALVCDRHRGLGADGLLVACLDGDDVTMILFNADGSRAEMSGNGIRCLAAAVMRSRRDGASSVKIATDVGIREVTLELHGLEGYGSVDMGTVTTERGGDLALGIANVGNPHAVVLDRPEWTTRDREDVAHELSGALGGANVEFVTVQSASHVSLVTFERGVGWTLACGTGSVACAAVLFENGLIGAHVTVQNPGGALVVDLDGQNCTLGGPVQFVADATWDHV